MDIGWFVCVYILGLMLERTMWICSHSVCMHVRTGCRLKQPAVSLILLLTVHCQMQCVPTHLLLLLPPPPPPPPPTPSNPVYQFLLLHTTFSSSRFWWGGHCCHHWGGGGCCHGDPHHHHNCFHCTGLREAQDHK